MESQDNPGSFTKQFLVLYDSDMGLRRMEEVRGFIYKKKTLGGFGQWSLNKGAGQIFGLGKPSQFKKKMEISTPWL